MCIYIMFIHNMYKQIVYTYIHSPLSNNCGKNRPVFLTVWPVCSTPCLRAFIRREFGPQDTLLICIPPSLLRGGLG